MIFYPTEGYHLSKTQYEAVISGIKALGEEGFVLSEIEYDGDFFKRGRHWWCKCPPYDDYASLPLTLENALYSRNSKWGAVISHEDHAVLGGCRTFIDEIRTKYPKAPTDLRRLRQFWNLHRNASWIEAIPKSPFSKHQ
jgi:hypothetical protein